MRNNKTFRMIRRYVFNKFMLKLTVISTILTALFDFSCNMYANDLSFDYYLDVVIFVKWYLFYFSFALIIGLYKILIILEKIHLSKIYYTHFNLLSVFNIIFIFTSYLTAMNYMISLSDEYVVHVSDIECIESQDNVECGEYYFAFDRPLDIKDAKSVQVFFERG